VIRAILFDLWGTLIWEGPAGEVRRREDARLNAAVTALEAHGLPRERVDVARAFRAAGDELGRIHAEGRDISAEARTILYLRHLDEGIAARLTDEGWRALHRAVLAAALEVRPQPIAGALASLAHAKAVGLTTVLVSNAGVTPGFVLREILDGHGALPWLDHTVFSDEVELSKPSPGIFEHALGAAGVAPDEAVFVGDQPILDVLGPRNAGIWSVQVGDLTEPGITPHLRIPRIDDFPLALDALRSGDVALATGGSA
jgi:putative hydrolase of the HAD superfamily